jgi:DNA-directed RNA polymerase specialized sigma24 family protein
MTDIPLDTYTVLALYTDGVLVADIAEKMGVTASTVRRRLKESDDPTKIVF